MGRGAGRAEHALASCALLTFHYLVKYSKVNQASSPHELCRRSVSMSGHVLPPPTPCSSCAGSLSFMPSAYSWLLVQNTAAILLPLNTHLSHSLALALIVLSARNVMRNCLCVLGVYDIIFVFSVCLSHCDAVCV